MTFVLHVHSYLYRLAIIKVNVVMNRKNLANIRQNFAQAVFTHQVQEAASNRKTDQAMRYKIVNITLVTTVLALLVVQAFIPSISYS